jgi:hypothetical protein
MVIASRRENLYNALVRFVMSEMNAILMVGSLIFTSRKGPSLRLRTPTSSVAGRRYVIALQ